MRVRLVVVGYMLASALAGSLASECSASKASPAALPKGAGLLCSDSQVICVPKSLEQSLISNPLELTVEANFADVEVAWEVVDSTGQSLESFSTFQYLEPFSDQTSSSKTLRLNDYALQPSKSGRGTLVLTPSRYDGTQGVKEFPKLRIPVRLNTATTVLTILLPADSEKYEAEVSSSIDDSKPFAPVTPLVPHSVTVMKVKGEDVMAATVEAVLRAKPGQAQWHVTGIRVDGKTAHVRITGDNWAGVSYYARSVYYLVAASLRKFPGIKHVVFD